LELPCAVLHTRGNERVCSDYERRPLACRAFECKVLPRYKSGELSRADAFSLVTKARTLVASVEKRIAASSKANDPGATLSALIHGGAQRAQALDAETLLDLGVLQSLVLPAFHESRKREKANPAEDASLFARANDRGAWRRLFAPVANDLLEAVLRLSPQAP
jgi:hypothetical protein